jgi:hypothetical protein
MPANDAGTHHYKVPVVIRLRLAAHLYLTTAKTQPDGIEVPRQCSDRNAHIPSAGLRRTEPLKRSGYHVIRRHLSGFYCAILTWSPASGNFITQPLKVKI